MTTTSSAYPAGEGKRSHSGACVNGARVPARADGRRARARRPLLVRSRRCCRATSRTSPAWRRCRSASPGRCCINGEHAQGEFYVPLATTEGTLVASYNRGMRLLDRVRRRQDARSSTTACSARRCSSSTTRSRGPRVRRLGRRALRRRSGRRPRRRRSVGQAHRTSSSTRSARCATCASTTRPATPPARTWSAGPRSPPASGSWSNYPGPRRLLLSESNIATDKKHSQINIMRTRGKRVVAEAVIPRDVLIQSYAASTPRRCSTTPDRQRRRASSPASDNNGAHAANGITAMFIATGQDVANVVRVARRRSSTPSCSTTATTTGRSPSRR